VTSQEPASLDAGDRWSAARRLVPIALLLLLAFALRVHRIGEQRVWWDEGWSVWAARFSPLDILRQTGNDVHPPLYFELLHLWQALSGDSEAGLRLLSAFLGLLTVALTYALSRRMARGALSPGRATAAGILAALFLAVSRFAIAWSQEIRMYALASLLAVLVVWAARRVWERGLWRDSAVYILATTAGLYTLYLFAPVWVAINIAWLATLRPRPSPNSSHREGNRVLPRVLPWLGLQLLIAALFLPWALYATGGFLSTVAATPIRLIDFLHIYWTVLTVGIPVDVAQFNRLTLPALVVFLGAVGALAIKVTANRRPPTANDGPQMANSGGQRSAVSGRQPIRDLILLLTILLLPAIIVYVISLPKQNFYNPPFNPRYLVIFTPFYSILLAWGLVTLGVLLERREASGQWAVDSGQSGDDGSKLATRHSPLATHPRSGDRSRLAVSGRPSLVGGLLLLLLTAFMLAVAVVGLWPYYPGRVLIDDYPSLVGTIDAYRQPGDAVVLYSDTDWPIFAYHHPEAWQGVPHPWTITPETAADYLAPIWDAHDAVWLVTTPYSAGGDPQRHIPAWLAERATAVREFTYKDMALTLYTRTAERAALADTLTDVEPPHSLDVPLTDGGRLVGYSQAARDFKSGDTIHLFLYWTGNNNPVDTEVGLIDSAGSIWQPTAVNLSAAAGIARRQVDVLVPAEAPDGDYRFYVLGADGRPAPFGDLTVTQKRAEFLTIDDVTIANPSDAQFGDGIRLLGYDLIAGSVSPGEPLRLTLYWSSDGDVRQRYKVFTHLLGDAFNAASGNFLWGQADNEPAANTRPTTTWRGAEVIVDEYAIPVPADAPPGVYRIEVGLYEPVSGERLPLLGEDGTAAADHLILSTIEIVP
jgi:hypothetical protein